MEVKAKIINRRDSEQNWIKENPILLSGELGIVDSINSTDFKIGNGHSKFNELPTVTMMLLSKIYPVGAVYFSTDKTNPQELFGFGTWLELELNITYLSFNSPKIHGWHRIK